MAYVIYHLVSCRTSNKTNSYERSCGINLPAIRIAGDLQTVNSRRRPLIQERKERNLQSTIGNIAVGVPQFPDPPFQDNACPILPMPMATITQFCRKILNMTISLKEMQHNPPPP